MIAGKNSVCNGTAIIDSSAKVCGRCPYGMSRFRRCPDVQGKTTSRRATLTPLLASSYPRPKWDDKQLVHRAVLLKVRLNPLLCLRRAHVGGRPKAPQCGESSGLQSKGSQHTQVQSIWHVHLGMLMSLPAHVNSKCHETDLCMCTHKTILACSCIPAECCLVEW